MINREQSERHPTERAVTARVMSVKELLRLDISVPEYQRPYRWGPRPIAQLIEDVDTFSAYDRYRIGTVIVHQGPEGLEVVDGQQRLLTFGLVLRVLASCGVDDMPSAPDVRLPAMGVATSRDNLRAGYDLLSRFLGRRPNHELREWAAFFLESCEVVLLELQHLDEAFQMFDSQNTRGRSLYPTDLLKAFHIREMSNAATSPQARSAMVRLWEEIPPASINALFADYLFKIKRWANGHPVPVSGFASEHVDLFKGIRDSDRDNARNRWARPFLYAKNFTDDFAQENATLVRYGVMQPVDYPFQIDQPVVNGETFFQMVRHYYELGRRLGLLAFEAPRDAVIVEADRTGVLPVLDDHGQQSTYRLVRNLWECLLLYYVDRFDEQNLSDAMDLVSRVALSPRVQLKQVRRVALDKYARGESLRNSGLLAENLFAVIREATTSREVLRRTVPIPVANGYPELHHVVGVVAEPSREKRA